MSTPEPKAKKGVFSEYISDLPVWAVPATTAALAGLGAAILVWLTPDTTEWTFPARLVLLAEASVGMLFLCLALVCRQLYKRTRKVRRYGILWDADKQPVCPKCEAPLPSVPLLSNRFALKCSICQIEFETVNEGTRIEPKDAIKRMRGGAEPDMQAELDRLRHEVRMNEFEMDSMRGRLQYYEDGQG